MWRQIGDAVGVEKRDSVWDHPDLLPRESDITNPSALIAKLRGGSTPSDAMDEALRELLGD
jgi:uncharacterized protein (DUF2342 family)